MLCILGIRVVAVVVFGVVSCFGGTNGGVCGGEEGKGGRLVHKQ